MDDIKTIILISIFIIFGLLWLYCAIMALSNKKDSIKSAIFFDFWMFMPDKFTEDGNKYRKASLMILLLMFIVFMFFVKTNKA